MKRHYVTKSFFCMGKDTGKCLDCKYCRLLDKSSAGFNITTAPSEINPLFTKFPVAINLFFGDPMLQIKNTVKLLRKLERVRHEGPVIIITKAPVQSLETIKSFDLDTHICLSTFGRDHPLDGSSIKVFENNLAKVSDEGIRMSIEFRPIIRDVNDSEEIMERVFSYAKNYKAPIGYCGLQGKPEVLQNILKNNYQIEPYPGTKFNAHKKHLGKDIENKILDFSKRSKVPVFKKTSCLVSYQHNFERDYNAHYYRPEEVGCPTCIMKEKCFAYYNSLNESVYEKTRNILPYKHEIVHKDKHTCILANQGICESVTPHCFNIKGYLIKTDTPLTTADVRATKWLTGLTMDVKMIESYHLSKVWSSPVTSSTH